MQTMDGNFRVFSVSLASGLNVMNASFSAFSPLPPCGSHVAPLNYTGMSQQGPWKEAGVLPAGENGWREMKEAGFE